MASDLEKASAELQQLVADADLGGRKNAGLGGKIIFGLCVTWSLFQLWYASPLPFILKFGVLNDTQARAIHLGIALFLAFLAFPAMKTPSQRAAIPWWDWALAAAAAFAGSYLFWFYGELALRPGKPTQMDIWVAVTGLVLLLEATRRAVGWPMAGLAIAFLAYCVLGPHLPDVLSHKGASLSRLMSQQWLTTEGVFGIALGVSVSAIFVYVLFGSLLDRAGGGNYMMQVSFAMLGHLRGGPAKVSVVSSALNGMISGSSVSNVVSGGIFTIPLMKKTGYGGIKAGAIETMASVDGQIMPPVMGAAAFLMVEYVGIPYSDIVKHAFLPAILSYIGLFYIVHLEAVKMGMMPLIARSPRTVSERLQRLGLGVSGSLVVIGVLYYALTFAKQFLGDAAGFVIAGLAAAVYVIAIRFSAASPDLPQDIDIEKPRAMDTWATAKAGLHFLLPVGTLIWCLMVEDMSPSLAAFWAIVVLVALMVSQYALLAFFRKQNVTGQWVRGFNDVVHGFHDGARNMIGIAVATGTAGIIVGAITLTGLGLRMTEFVEFVSQGNVVLMLIFVAFTCLVLGLGVPTTANYVLVATLMAPVVVELGAQNGIIIPLIAVHLFVFYYGIMGDITPPVGVATFAAAAISGEDAIKTGIQGSLYAIRTVILPFIWIFNPQLLLIDVHSTSELVRVVVASTIAMLIFCALTMNWFRVKLKVWEWLVLAAAVILLFRPDFFMDLYKPEFQKLPAAKMMDIAKDTPSNQSLRVEIKGTTLEGKDVTKTVAVQLGAAGEDGRKRLQAAGITPMALGDEVQIGQVKFGSKAQKSGFDQGMNVGAVFVPTDRPSQHWFYLPALALIAFVWFAQGRRARAGTQK